MSSAFSILVIIDFLVLGIFGQTNNTLLDKGFQLAIDINKHFPGEQLYQFVEIFEAYANSSILINETEYLFQETDCKKSEVKTTEERQFNCKPNIHRDILLCTDHHLTCHKEGDRYIIPLIDARTQSTAMTAVFAHNQKIPDDERRFLYSPVTVTSPMEREIVVGGWNDFLYFTTKEMAYDKPPDNKTKPVYYTTKPRLECKVELKVRMLKQDYGYSDKEATTNCKENKEQTVPLDPPRYLVDINLCTANKVIKNGTTPFYGSQCNIYEEFKNTTEKGSKKKVHPELEPRSYEPNEKRPILMEQ